MADGLKGIARLKRAMRVTSKAFAWAAKNEEAVQLELLGLFFLTPLAFWLGDSAVERVLLIGSLLLLLLVELLNSAIESAIDRIGPEHHELSGRAKDLGSAAVFVAMLIVALSWGLVLLG
ncbi:MAG: diacylglycerol kinase [Gammaproteobacteria bacterium]|nr:diacylglycerol kinase [Gammaproteobacteria bacterium]